MRVCFVSHTASIKGGAEKCLLEIVDLIEADGIECFVLLPEYGPLCQKLARRDLPWGIIPYKRWSGRRSSFLQTIFTVMRNLLMIIPVAIILRRWKINIVCSNTVTVGIGALVSFIFDIPHIWYLHEIPETKSRWHFDFGFERSMKIIDSLSSICIANSHAVAEYFNKFIHPKKIRVLYYGFQGYENTSNAPVKLPRIRPDSILKCVVVGTVAEIKGQDDAIHAVNNLAQSGIIVTLYIVGDGKKEYLEELKNIVGTNNLKQQVFFVPYQENPFPYYKHADIALMCTQNESLGRVTVEAMMSSKPVVGTRSGGTIEIIKDGQTGFLYTPGDFIDLAEKIKFFCDHPDAVLEMGRNGRQRAGTIFSIERYKTNLLHILKQI